MDAAKNFILGWIHLKLEFDHKVKNISVFDDYFNNLIFKHLEYIYNFLNKTILT